MSSVETPGAVSSVPASGFEVICESWGLSNLTPSQSRLFKLIGREKVCEVELQQALAYMVATYANENEKRRQSTIDKL